MLASILVVMVLSIVPLGWLLPELACKDAKLLEHAPASECPSCIDSALTIAQICLLWKSPIPPSLLVINPHQLF